MPEPFAIDDRFSTTKLLICEKPGLKADTADKFGSILLLPEAKHQREEGGLRTKGYFKKSFPDRPLASIITVVYNGEAYLEETIQSVINQTYDNVEYIIIDGGSSDGTVDIIKKYDDKIDYWVSEKDAGIYDAMNKGLRLASGLTVGIINADDFYVKNAVEESIKALLRSDADYTIGNVKKLPSNIVVSPLFPLNSALYQGMMYPHISAFIKREIYKKVGLFDTRYKVSADFDMALRIHTHGFKAVYVQQTIGCIQEGGVSDDERTKKENMCIAVAHGRNPLFAKTLYLYYRISSRLQKLLPLQAVKLIRHLKKSRSQHEQ